MIIRTSKELHKIYDYCNRLYFNNSLPRVPIKRRRLHKGRLAHTRIKQSGPHCIILRLSYKSAAELLTTLLHEMIHVERWQFSDETWRKLQVYAKAKKWSDRYMRDVYYDRIHDQAFKARAREIEQQIGVLGIL